jgi:hypothetical protein
MNLDLRAPRRVAPAVLVLAALVVLHVVPFWAFRYFPSQDGPSHVENAYVLANYYEGGRAYNQFFDVNARPVPNWLSHAALALLMKAFPPLASEKLLLTGYVVLFALSMLYFINSTCGRGKEWLVLVAFPLVSTYLFHMGFYNFVISFPLSFLAVGYWWRRRDAAPGWKWLIALNLILVLVYFASVLSQAVAVLCVLGLAVLHYGSRVRRTLLVAASLLPSCVLPLYFVLASSGEPPGVGGGLARWRYLATVGVLTSFDNAEQYVGIALAVILGILVVFALAKRPRWSRSDGGFLVMAIALVVLYLVAPARALGGGFILWRLSLFPLVIILPWIGARAARSVQIGAGLAAAVLAVVHLGISVHYYALLNRGLEEYTSGASLVGRNETVLPLTFDQKGGTERIRVYLHASGYYCLQGGISLADYEANETYFPLEYKPELNPFMIIRRIESPQGAISPERYPRPIDWVLLWSAPDEFPARPWIEANYRLAHERGNLRLYKRAAPGDPAPGRQAPPKPAAGLRRR